MAHYCTHLCQQRTILKYHGVVRSRELGQVPILVFLTLRQALSSHPRQQMVWLYWLQNRDSMPNWYTINHPTTLHTHNETQLPTVALRWHLVLQDVSRRQSCHLLTPSHPWVPPFWLHEFEALAFIFPSVQKNQTNKDYIL
jgi:hypothetical protein